MLMMSVVYPIIWCVPCRYMKLFDHITDHLNATDRDTILDKTARYLAEILAKQQVEKAVYNGQAALAIRLDCSRATVSKIMTEQRIKYSRVGRKGYQFREADVVEFLQAA